MKNFIDLSKVSQEVKDYISSLEKENEELKRKIEKLSLLVDSKNTIIKKQNIERFVYKKDIPNTGLKSTIEHPKKHPGKKFF